MGIFDKLFGEKESCCNTKLKETSCSCGGTCSSSTDETLLQMKQ